MEAIRNIGTVEILCSQKKQWRTTGDLAAEWKHRFPELFDEDDVRIVETQRKSHGAHFVEWLGAIVLHQTTGYRSLVAKYQFKKAHPHKQKIIKNVLPDPVLAALLDTTKHGWTQGPDLLMYERDERGSPWFFCEVKGPNDRRRASQDSKFEDLAAVSRKTVGVLWLKCATGPEPAAVGQSLSPWWKGDSEALRNAALALAHDRP